MTHYLVTGGTGFIGSHLVRSLLNKPGQVTVLDRRKPDESPILGDHYDSDLHYIQADLCDFDHTRRLVEELQPQVIFHLAAQPLSARSNLRPLQTVRDNVDATYSILEAARNLALQPRLVFSSSACFYGVPSTSPPLQESDSPSVGHYIYTATKIAADFAVQHYRQIYKLPCICARMVNVYGPGDIHSERIVPRLMTQALDGVSPTLTQSDGTDILSFLYVRDAVSALEILGSRADALRRSVWNIAGSEPVSVLDLMKLIYSSTGHPTDSFAAVGDRRGSPVHKYLDGSLIRNELDVEPEIGLTEGLNITLNWYRNFREFHSTCKDTCYVAQG